MNEMIRVSETALQAITGELVESNAGVELFLISDLSGSMRRRLHMLVAMLEDRLGKIAAAGVRKLAFHNFCDECLPWPNASWAQPRPIEQFPIPTVEAFAAIHGGGTALVSALRRVVGIAKSRLPGTKRVILMTDGGENSSKCWKFATPREKFAIREELLDAQKHGIFMGLVGFVLEHEVVPLYTLCEQLGIPANQVFLFEHQGDDRSVQDTMNSAGDSMTSMSTGF